MTISRSSFNNPVSNHPHHQTSYPPEPDEDPEGATLLLHQKHTGTEDGHENEDNMQVKEAGVARIEALYSVFGGTHGAPIWILYASIGLIAYVYSLDSNTTPSFLPFATSAFKAHSLLGTINVTNTIISAVAQPLIAKFADVTSRPRAYVLALVFYLTGYIIIATSHNVQSVAIGELCYTIGRTGLDLITEIIAADLSPLKWRGFATALPASPFIINAFISAEIVQAILGEKGDQNWRYGYAIFIILMPIVMAPALMILFWAEYKAKRMNTVTISSSAWDRRTRDTGKTQSFWNVVKDFCIHIDALGLALLAFGYGLILLPFTLYKKLHVEANADLAGMFFAGVALIIAFAVYEFRYAPIPLMSWRLFNRTFVCAIIIDLFYFMSGNMRSQYYASWVFVVKDWTFRGWTLFNHIVTVGLCVFGLIVGVILRYSHRYKWLQFTGLCIRILGMVLTLYARGENATTSNLIWTQILISLGGSCSVVGSRVASQASVKHEDMATVIALLSLWTKLGGSAGYAIAAAIWNAKMPVYMHERLPNLSKEQIADLFGSIKDARNAAPEVRAGVIEAYNDTVYLLYLPALLLSFIPLAASVFMKNYYLGEAHDAADQSSEGEVEDDDDHHPRIESPSPSSSRSAPSTRSSSKAASVRSRSSVLDEETPLLTPPEVYSALEGSRDDGASSSRTVTAARK